MSCVRIVLNLSKVAPHSLFLLGGGVFVLEFGNM